MQNKGTIYHPCTTFWLNFYCTYHARKTQPESVLHAVSGCCHSNNEYTLSMLFKSRWSCMISHQNPHFNVNLSQVVSTSTGASTPDTPPGAPLIPLIQGGTAVAAVIALTVYSKTIIEAITKLVKEAKDD
ncbi:hypothetical protein [Moorena producens]|nr:hypothetical protein [Moorena producens]